MFEGLRKKFSDFVSSITKKEETELKEEAKEEKKAGKEAAATEKAIEKEEVKIAVEKLAEEERIPKREIAPEVGKVERIVEAEMARPEPAKEREREREKAVERPRAVERQKPAEAPIPVKERQEVTIKREEKARPVEAAPAPTVIREQKPEERKRTVEMGAVKEKVGVTLTTKLKGIVFSKVRLKEEDVDPFLEELKINLLKSDVNYDVAEKIIESMKKNLLGSEFGSRSISQGIDESIRSVLMQTLSKGDGVDIIKEIRERKARHETPYKILFLGPNGAGKTTTMAKVAHALLASGITCILSASDTFRAAAIEQTSIHAGRLGIGVIKGTYGADPASIAFDAIAHAKAHGIDCVLIDTAGRQETNKSLIEEVKKMARVNSPDIKIFIGESIAGNSLLEQVRQFNEAVKLDGIILTKLDCDAKGGNTLSILSETSVPVLFFGTGERYEDLVPYSADFILDSMIPQNA